MLKGLRCTIVGVIITGAAVCGGGVENVTEILQTDWSLLPSDWLNSITRP